MITNNKDATVHYDNNHVEPILVFVSDPDPF